jgi:hypothetical protein
MTYLEVAMEDAQGGQGTTHASHVQELLGVDGVSDDDSGSASSVDVSTAVSDFPAPQEDELLSKAAESAILQDERLSQAGQASDQGQDSSEPPAITTPRAYQLEMCEESMKRNIIAVVRAPKTICRNGTFILKSYPPVDGYWKRKNTHVTDSLL